MMSNQKGEVDKIQTQREIGVLIYGEDEVYRGYLTSVGDSSIYVDGNLIYLSEIEAIRIYKPFFKTFGVAQRIAAAGVIGLNVTNNLLSGYRPVLEEHNIWWAVGLFATSYIWDYFSRETHYSKDGWEWETINFQRLGE